MATASIHLASHVAAPSQEYRPGVAPVRPEFVIAMSGSGRRNDECSDVPAKQPEVETVGVPGPDSEPAADGHSANGDGDGRTDNSTGAGADGDVVADGEPDAKKPKLKGAARKRAKREENAAKRALEKQNKQKGGQNKNRKFGPTGETKGNGLCDSMIRAAAVLGDGVLDPRRCNRGGPPPHGGCWHEHDAIAYLASKPKDVAFPPPPPALASADCAAHSASAKDSHLLRPVGQSTSVSGLPPAGQTYLDKHYFTSPPFVRWIQDGPSANAPTEDAAQGDAQGLSSPPDPAQSLRPGTYCPPYAEHGSCQAGWRCRMMGAHAHKLTEDKPTAGSEHAASTTSRAGPIELDGVAVPKNEDDWVHALGTSRHALGEYNWVPQGVMRALRKKEYPLPYTSVALRKLAELPQGNKTKVAVTAEEAREEFPQVLRQVREQRVKVQQQQQSRGKRKRGPPSASVLAPSGEVDWDALENEGAAPASTPAAPQQAEEQEDLHLLYDISSIDLARPRSCEKKRLDWRGDLYLAPLTTVGNLPFRRLCTTFGVDITCGEMGLAESYCAGNPSEWSLVRRWESERTFGAQLCGSRQDQLVPVAEALYNECGPQQLDFVDLNCGCPIDLVCNRGGGSALMDHIGRLGTIVKGMNAVLGEIPVTVKVRTGTTGSRTQTAHNLLPRLPLEFGAGAVTLHGRSKQQRYKSMADWAYIAQCARGVRAATQRTNEEASEADAPEMTPIPVYGNGDVYSYEDYDAHMSLGELDGCMIGRGGLIKPWLFTEIKEHRDWDISSRERLDMVRQFCHYGLAHWGADAHGVQLTRRFLCEAMSFWHRYVPLGLLEYLPPRLNDRPPTFHGRDELETLLASGNAADWVKVSDMFLGPAPPEWQFVPKHKSNSYDTEAQG